MRIVVLLHTGEIFLGKLFLIASGGLTLVLLLSVPLPFLLANYFLSLVIFMLFVVTSLLPLVEVGGRSISESST